MKKNIFEVKANEIMVMQDWDGEYTVCRFIEVSEVGKHSSRVTYNQLKKFKKKGKFSSIPSSVRVWHDEDVYVFPTVSAARKFIEENNDDEMLPFFVYGTLRSGFGNYEAYLRGNTEAEAPAYVTGALWHTGSVIPYMTKDVVEGTSGVVHGELMWVPENIYKQVLSGLDGLEGYRKGSTWNHYNREKVVATLEDGSTVEAWAYYYGDAFGTQERNRFISIPDGDYAKWRIARYQAEKYIQAITVKK
jgi:gamma-glutamylcyclotransferase (GGCT)/AIG2-like uncharacterized protein YtfP